MTITLMGYLKSHPATKQEAQPYDSDQSTSHKNTAQRGERIQGRYQIPEAALGRLKTAKKWQKRPAHLLARFWCIPLNLISLARFETKGNCPAHTGQGFLLFGLGSGYLCVATLWRRLAMLRYRLTKVRICLTIRLVFLGRVSSTSWSPSKVGKASKKFSTSCCFCSRGIRTRV